MHVCELDFVFMKPFYDPCDVCFSEFPHQFFILEKDSSNASE